MLKVQNTKMCLADAALGEGKGVRPQNLSIKEIKDVRSVSLPVCESYLTCSTPAVRHVSEKQQA